MSMHDVVVIDYGVGNLLSVQRAFDHCDAKAVISSDPDVIRRAARVVLPGVGAFANAMASLSRGALDQVVREVASSGVPLLGICLGMQMLMDESEEFGVTPGLGQISGRVIPVPTVAVDGAIMKIPSIGWYALQSAGDISWGGTALQDVRGGEAVYFVHSFMASPIDPCHRIADYVYGGNRITAVIRRDNVIGCQFHPEKSGDVGLRILRRFLTL
jgi:glutamine amidotransferase